MIDDDVKNAIFLMAEEIKFEVQDIDVAYDVTNEETVICIRLIRDNLVNDDDVER